MQRWALRFGYDGRSYQGWARQPGQRTVEGTIRTGLVRCGVVRREDRLHLAVASRTDRGVSARANVLAIDSNLPEDGLLGALNGLAPDIFFTASAPVDASFSPRAAIWRRYRYFEPAHGRRLDLWKTAGRLFEGPVDVRSFGRGIRSKSPVLRPVDLVRVRRMRDVFVVEVQAPGFVWGMVRKMVAGLRAVDLGHLTLDQLESAVRGTTPLMLPLAEPERLVLWEVRISTRWRHRLTRLTRMQERYFENARDDVAVSRALLTARPKPHSRPEAEGPTRTH